MNHKRVISILIFVSLTILSCAPLNQAEPTPSPGAQMRALAAPPTPVFTNCDPDQVASLQRALLEARSLTHEALQALENAPESGRDSFARYHEWFGNYDPANYSLVTENFQHIEAALATQTISFNCTCSEDQLAHVYTNQPYEITLCEKYWIAPATGTDSQAGVLVHELSHFLVVAGTQDVTYGQILARMTAKYIPARAVQNAESYMYFAENDPPLP